jgi:hypothetical protein
VDSLYISEYLNKALIKPPPPTQSGTLQTLHNNFELVFSGNVNDSHADVAVIMDERFANHIENIQDESSRTFAVTLNINQQRTSFIQAYAPIFPFQQ